jgi:hypothetical protein
MNLVATLLLLIKVSSCAIINFLDISNAAVVHSFQELYSTLNYIGGKH